MILALVEAVKNIKSVVVKIKYVKESCVMKTFKELVYERPDFEAEKAALKQYITDIKNAASYAELRKVFLDREEASRHFDTMFNVAYIRNSVDTRDSFYDEEMTNFYQRQGELTLLEQEATAAILQSPYLAELKQEFGELLIKEMETGQKLASPEVVEDMVRDSALCQEYNRVISACNTDFGGETCNFTGLLKHMQSVDRKERKEAFRAWADMYEGVSGELDRIYDRMIEVRSCIAQKLGFDSYISFIYARMGRFDYGPEDVKVFRKQVKDYLVPLCQKLFEEQAGRLGVEMLHWYDEQLTDPDGNAVPVGNKDAMLGWGKEMYRELSPETSGFFDFMLEHELFDLETRLGKQPGGYCTFLKEEKAPFIFSNFNGTSADVDVLTHEAGHAFEAYTASRIYPLSAMVWSSSEINEIHSMSMEFFTYPWMEKFFGDKADRYRMRHLAQALEAVPYMICVDEFQHRVFEERLDAGGRRRAWHELEQTYMPWRSYDGNTFLENGGFWMQKLHIFVNPFYYVDYALAQMGAFEFYKMMGENREQAWADYYKLCKSGGSRGYFETLAYAGLSNPFQEGTLKEIAEFLETKFFS